MPFRRQTDERAGSVNSFVEGIAKQARYRANEKQAVHWKLIDFMTACIPTSLHSASEDENFKFWNLLNRFLLHERQINRPSVTLCFAFMQRSTRYLAAY